MEGGDVVMIFAGYNDAHMDEFITLNPGLFRRIHHVFTFENYAPEELAQILLLKIASSGFRLEPSLEDATAVAGLLVAHTTREQRARMNGGLCDHVLRHAKRHLDARLTGDEAVEALLTYTAHDLQRACADLPTPPPLASETTPTDGRTARRR